MNRLWHAVFSKPSTSAFLPRRLAHTRHKRPAFGNIAEQRIPIIRLTTHKSVDENAPPPQPVDEPKPSKTVTPFRRKMFEVTTPIQAAARRSIERRVEKSEKEHAKKSSVVIGCSKPELNHYEATVFDPEKGALISEHWHKEKHAGEWFVVKRFIQSELGALTEAKGEEKCGSWAELEHLEPKIIENAIREGAISPTQFQSMMANAFRSPLPLLGVEATGRGKTIAVAVPLLSWMLKNPETRAIVCAPTDALVRQIAGVLERLTSQTEILIGGSRTANKDWRVLVGTPQEVARHLRKRPTAISELILDEADTLLDSDFQADLTELVQLIPLRNGVVGALDPDGTYGARLVLISATAPPELVELTSGLVDERRLRIVRSKRAHILPQSVEMRFERILNKDKPRRLLEIVGDTFARSPDSRALIFCRNGRSAMQVADTLKTGADMAERYIQVILGKQNVIAPRPEARVIIATDALSRGLDLADCALVLQYDGAQHLLDHLHRVGRVGRLGNRTHGQQAVSFVCTGVESEVAKRVELSVRLGRRPLTDIETDLPAIKKESVKSKQTSKGAESEATER